MIERDWEGEIKELLVTVVIEFMYNHWFIILLLMDKGKKDHYN